MRNEDEIQAAPDLIAEVLDQANEIDAVDRASYFGAARPGYPEGDRFVGVRVPVLRGIARRRHPTTTLADLEMLLDSEWHEIRLLAGILAVERFKRSDGTQARSIVNLVLDQLAQLDNWDLVDAVAPYVLGEWLRDNPSEGELTALMESADQWSRRFALVATLGLIRADIRIAIEKHPKEDRTHYLGMARQRRTTERT